MMYMLVEIKRKITRAEVVELPDIRGTDLTDEQTTSCDEKAKSLCRKGEVVVGWKLFEEYELKMLKKRWATLNEPWYNSPVLTYNNKDEEVK